MDTKNIEVYTCEPMSAKVTLKHCQASHETAVQGSICSVCQKPLYMRKGIKPSGSYSLDRGLDEMEARTGIGANLIGALARAMEGGKIIDAGTPAHHVWRKLEEGGFSKKEILEACERGKEKIEKKVPARELAMLLQGGLFVTQRILAQIKNGKPEPMAPEEGETISKSRAFWERALDMGFTRESFLRTYVEGELPFRADKLVEKKLIVNIPERVNPPVKVRDERDEDVVTLFSAACSKEDEGFLSRVGRVSEILKECRSFLLEKFDEKMAGSVSISFLPSEKGTFLELNMDKSAAMNFDNRCMQELYDVLARKVAVLSSAKLARELCSSGLVSLVPFEDGPANPESSEEMGRARLLSILKSSARFRKFGDMECSFVPSGNIAVDLMALAPRKDVRQWAMRALRQ